MSKKRILFLFGSILFGSATFAQVNIDSLFAQASREMKNGNLDQGLILLDSVLKIDNYYTPALASRAYLNAATNQDFNQVLDDLLQYSTITKSASNFVEIGYLYLENGKNDLAFQLSDFAINKGFFDHNTYIIRGSTFFELGQYKEAEQDFKKALELKSDERYAMNLLIRTYVEQGSLDKALAQANQLVEISPDDDIALGIRAGVLARMGKYEEALSDNSKSMQLAKGFKGRGYFAEKRAYIYQEMGNKEEACRWAVVAMRSGNNTPYFSLRYPCDEVLHFDLSTANTLLFRLKNPLDDYDFQGVKERLIGMGIAIGTPSEKEINFLVDKAQFTQLPITIDTVMVNDLKAEKPVNIAVFDGEYAFVPSTDKELYTCTKGEKADLFYIQCVLAQTADGKRSIWVDENGVILKYTEEGYTIFELLKID